MSTASGHPADTFLSDHGDFRPWNRPAGTPDGLETEGFVTGFGFQGFEVALATAVAQPKMDAVRRLWKTRANRGYPTLLVVAYPVSGTWQATLCGTEGDPAAVAGLELDQVERMCAAVLAEPDSSKAKRTYERLLSGTKDQLITGLSNQGLFASHELRAGVPVRSDWPQAQTEGKTLLAHSPEDLMRGLGYTLTAHGSTTYVLATPQTRQAVAVFLDQSEAFDRPSSRFNAASPVAKGVAFGQEQNLPWLIVTRGTQIRLYPTKPDVGVGSKGQSETFVELDLATLENDDAGYLPLLFSPSALEDGGSVAQILSASADHAAALGKRLRERVYHEVVPKLAVAIGNQMKNTQGSLDEEDLAVAYHRTLIILFRLLFVAYAEDRGLLPYQRNPHYTRKALKTFARDYAQVGADQFDPKATDLWDDLLAVWLAVDDGHSDWHVPAYNGGLFAADESHPDGGAIRAMSLTNSEVGPALQSLLIDTGEDGAPGPVDFRSLSVREFGTLYEGLLESSLSVAVTDLKVDAKTQVYLPAKPGDDVAVATGEVYFHNSSGARKATGSYFTKSFAVERLLSTALDPAIDDHLTAVKALLDDGDEAGAASKFFDFRIADLAMGSGHFLVAAVDRAESRFATFLTANPIPAVNNELRLLSDAAREQVRDFAADIEIEPSTLLRRQIARRCIYGLDINLMAVELARLALWIHTFVPGLPMSTLDHGLVHGNSLTGIGSVEEALDALRSDKEDRNQLSIFGEPVREALEASRKRLVAAAENPEARKADVKRSSAAQARARLEAGDAHAIFTAAVGRRLGVFKNVPLDTAEAIELGRRSEVAARVEEQKPAHLPYLFPEVFMRENPGFDVVLGNPPWEKVKVEEHVWWGLRFPGLRSMSQRDKNAALAKYRAERPDLVEEYNAEVNSVAALRDIIKRGPFPGMSGDTDLYKAFCWRDWDLLRHGGRAGIVFPRGALSGSGTALWRETILKHGAFEDVCFLTNTGKWVFDEVDGRYTVALTTIRKGGDHTVTFQGPFHSKSDLDAASGKSITVDAEEFCTWASGYTFPLLPSADSAEIFRKMRQHPRFDAATHDWSWRVVRELDTAMNKSMYDFSLATPQSDTPVLTGASFNLWSPDSGAPYAYADRSDLEALLTSRRERQIRLASSAFSGLSEEWARDATTLPLTKPRIAFRDVARATDSRTVIAALVPGNVGLVEKAPYLFCRAGDASDEAFVLGIMSSIPFDWYARRYVELKLSIELLNAFPVPRPDRESPLRQRVVEVAGRLAAVDSRYAEWAAEVLVPVGSVATSAEKDDLIAELDALAGLLYGLTRSDMEHVFETFHRGWTCGPRLTAVLGHYDDWKVRG